MLTKRTPKRTVPTATVAPLEPALPVRYRVDVYSSSVNGVVGSFCGATPFLFHVGELFDPTGLVEKNADVSQGWLKIIHIVHSISKVDNSHVAHRTVLCVTAVPQPR